LEETPSRTAKHCTMADVVLDANVLVGYFDQNDALDRQSLAVMQELKETGDTGKVLDLVQRSNGVLNFHDATLLVLQEDGTIGPVATFDEALARYPGFIAWD
jgi:predicted nucleic acid-binding protein